MGRRIAALVLFVLGTLGHGGSASACSPTLPAADPGGGPVPRGAAFAILAGVGALTGSASMAAAPILDERDRFPVLATAFLTAPGVLLSSFLLTPGDDCTGGSLEYSDVASRTWLPALAGVAPTALLWLLSGSSTSSPDVRVSASVSAEYQGLALTTSW